MLKYSSLFILALISTLTIASPLQLEKRTSGTCILVVTALANNIGGTSIMSMVRDHSATAIPAYNYAVPADGHTVLTSQLTWTTDLYMHGASASGCSGDGGCSLKYSNYGPIFFSNLRNDGDIADNCMLHVDKTAKERDWTCYFPC